MAQPTIYRAAGGAAAMLAWASAFHERALADAELAHTFARRLNPHHVERLAAYLGEVLGGPPAYTHLGADHATVVRMHVGESGGADMTSLKAAFVACAEAGWRDAGLPDDLEILDAVHDYLVWAVEDMVPAHDDPALVPEELALPRWSWNGLERPPRGVAR